MWCGRNNLDRTGLAEGIDQRLASALRAWACNTGVIDLWRTVSPSAKDFFFFSARQKYFS